MARPKLSPSERNHNLVWEIIKKEKFYRIEHPRAKHKSLTVSLRREANRDTEFIQALKTQSKTFTLRYSSLGDLLLVTLYIERI